MKNLEAERWLLGGLFLDPGALDDVASLITPGDFFDSKHGKVYEAMLALAEDGQPIDRPSVNERLTSRGDLASVGEELVELLDRTSTESGNLVHYARIVRGRARMRRLASAAAGIAKSAREGAGEDADAILDEAERIILALREEHNTTSFKSMRDVARATINRLEQLHNAQSAVTGLATGIGNLDVLTGGLHIGQLIILAARPKMGKTALALQIADHIAALGRGVGIFSLEMTTDELGPRFFANRARVDGQRLRSGQLEDSDWSKIVLAAGELAELPIEIDDTLTSSIHEIRAKARRLAHRRESTKTPLGLIIVDYLQLAGEFGEHREQEIAQISRGLKALAKELQVPVLALSQLNRGLEKRPDRRPVLSDLRDSGALEQDADLVLFIYRDEVYCSDSEDRGIAEIIIGAQRNGPIGVVKTMFLAPFMRFENPVRQSRPTHSNHCEEEA